MACILGIKTIVFNLTLRGQINMNKYLVTFEHYNRLLKRSFVNYKEVKTMADFDLYVLAMFHGQVKILNIKEIA